MSAAGITLEIANLVCTGVTVTALDSTVRGSVQSGSVGLALRVQGIGGRCSGSFVAKGGLLIGGGVAGDVRTDIQGGADSSAALEISFPLDDKGMPTKVEATSCTAHLQFQVALSGGTIARWINWLASTFSGYISSTIQSQVLEIGCSKLKELAATSLTQKLQQLNGLLRPPSAGSSRPQAPADAEVHVLSDAAAAQSIDWTQQEALAWGSWFLGEVVGPKGINKAMSWALQNATSAVIPGPKDPLVEKVINQTDVGLTLEVGVRLKEVTLDGVESLRELAPFTAAAPDQLQGKVSFGTEAQPAVGIKVTALLTVKAEDSAGGAAAQTVQEELSLHLGLSKPSLAGRVQLLCSAEKWGETRKVAQWYFGAVGCAKSLLLQPPAVQSLDVHFAGLAAPLTFASNTEGQLEGDIAKVLNNGVHLFNMVYEKLLPGAIGRLAGSPDSLSAMNTALASQLQPGTCVSAREAEEQAEKLPRYFSNWTALPLLSGWLRDMVDNTIDGFIAQNNSEYAAGISMMPPISFGPVHDLHAKKLAFLGTDQISKLRILLPNSTEPKSLSMQVDVKCPTDGKAYRPSLVVDGEVTIGTSAVAGSVTSSAPCGSVTVRSDVVVDFWELMRLPLPPRMACMALQPLSELTVASITSAWKGGGGLVLRSRAGVAQEPLEELCRMHPDLCALLERLGSYLLSPTHLTEIIHDLRNSVLAGCDGEALEQASAWTTTVSTAGDSSSTGTWKTDTLGFHYLPPETVGLWVVAVGASFALAAVVTAVVACLAGGPMSATLAGECWRRWHIAGPMLTFAISLLLAASLAFRLVACLFLPYASASMGAVMPSTGAELLDVTVVMYTYLGTMKEFWLGGSAYCAIFWVLTGIVSAPIVHVAMAAVWLLPLGRGWRMVLVRFAIFFGRCPFADLETMGNMSLAMIKDIDMPLDMQVRVRMLMEVGAQVSLITAAVTILSGLALLALASPGQAGAQDGASPGQAARPKRVSRLACGSLLVGLAVFLSANYLHFDVGGGAGAVMPPVSFAGHHLSRTGGTMAPFLVVTCLLAPLLQVSAVALGLSPRTRGSLLQVVLAEVGVAFSCLDIFFLGYTLTFLEGVTSFTKIAVYSAFRPACDLLQKAVNQDCMVIIASVSPVGLLGIIMAGLGAICLTVLHFKDCLRKDLEGGSRETFLHGSGSGGACGVGLANEGLQ